jgi:hypothetical protein
MLKVVNSMADWVAAWGGWVAAAAAVFTAVLVLKDRLAQRAGVLICWIELLADTNSRAVLRLTYERPSEIHEPVTAEVTLLGPGRASIRLPVGPEVPEPPWGSFVRCSLYPRAEHRMTGDVLAQVSTGEVVDLSVRIVIFVGRSKVLTARREVRIDRPPPRVMLERDREWRRKRGYRIPGDLKE